MTNYQFGSPQELPPTGPHTAAQNQPWTAPTTGPITGAGMTPYGENPVNAQYGAPQTGAQQSWEAPHGATPQPGPGQHYGAPQYGAPQYAGPTVQHFHQQVVTINNSGKSVGVAFLLTFLFGALGVFYSSVTGGIVMSIAWFLTLILGVLTLGFGWVLFFFVWVGSIIWGCIAASGSNSRSGMTITQG